MWQWPKLRKWIEEEAGEASKLRFCREAARKGLRLTGPTLEEAQALRSRIAVSPEWAKRYLEKPGEIQETLAGIAESERAQRNQIQRLWYFLMAAVLVALVMGWLAWRAVSSQRVADEQLARNYWELSRSAQARSDDQQSLHFAAEAIHLFPQLQGSVLWDVRSIWPQSAVVSLVAHQGSVQGARFNRDESRILTWSKDGTARVWDAHTGQALGPALQHQSAVLGAQYSRDESRILTWSGDMFGKKVTRVCGMRAPGKRWSLRSSIKIGYWGRSSAGTRAASSPGVLTKRRVCGMRAPGTRWA